MATREQFWRIDETPIDGHPQPEATFEPGEGYELTVQLSPFSDDPAGQWPSYTERYGQFLDRFMANQGLFATDELIGGGIVYTEAHSGESLLVALRPPEGALTDSDPRVHGMWALVESLEDKSFTGTIELAFGFVAIATLAAYPDKAAVRAAHEREGFH